MPTTTNYGWTTPADTDLVKDGASAIRTLGTAIDTTVFNNASAAIAKTIVDAKGDLIAATAADTVSKLSVGANDTVLTADSSTATGLKWATASSGGMTLLETLTLSGASVTSSTIAGTYKNLQIIVRNFLPATDNVYLLMRMNGNTSGVYKEYKAFSIINNTPNDTYHIVAEQQDNAVSQQHACINVYDYANTVSWKIMDWASVGNNATTTTNVNFTGTWGIFASTSAITSVTFLTNSGNLTSGSALIYGVS